MSTIFQIFHLAAPKHTYNVSYKFIRSFRKQIIQPKTGKLIQHENIFVIYISGENGIQNVQKYSHWMLHPRQRRPLSVDDAPLAEALLSVESPESFDDNSGVFWHSLGSSPSSLACERESGMVSCKVSSTPNASTLSQPPKRRLYSSHEGLYFLSDRLNNLMF